MEKTQGKLSVGKVLNFRPGDETAVFHSGTQVRKSTRWPWKHMNWPLKKMRECVSVGVGCWDCSERVMQAISFSALHPLQQFLLSSVTSHEPPPLPCSRASASNPYQFSPCPLLLSLSQPIRALLADCGQRRGDLAPMWRGGERRVGFSGHQGQFIAHLSR